MPVFPSVEWFEEAADRLNKSDSFERLGTCDTDMGVQVGDDYYEITFEAFECSGVKEIDAARADELDFVLVQSPEAWKDMLENIKQNGHAEHEYTLNSLDLNTETEFALGKDYTRRDAFYRFNQTLQDFFDFTATMETTYKY
jgi:hypothetical protein